jgi:hypothetical protein
MSQYGSTFLTAEVMLYGIETYNILTDSNDDSSYFKFTITSTDNQVILNTHWIDYPNWIGGTSTVSQVVYDSTETQIYINNSTSDDINTVYNNLAIGDYYVKFNTTSNDNGRVDYKIIVYNDGGIILPPINVERFNNITTTYIDYYIQANLITHNNNFIIQSYTNWIPEHIKLDSMYKFYTNQKWMDGKDDIKILSHRNPRLSKFNYYKNNQVLYKINGIVYLDETPLENKVVRLYEKQTGVMVDETISNNLGEYKFNALLEENDKYYVVAFDEINNPVFQALALDDLSPTTVTL